MLWLFLLPIVDRKSFDNLIVLYDCASFLATEHLSSAYLRFVDQLSSFAETSKRVFRGRRRQPQHAWLPGEVLSAIKYKVILWR